MALEVRDICYSYGKEEVLKDISLRAERGEFVSILGPSGCGKSTLLNILAGLLPSGSGEVVLDGEALSGVSGRFAYMPQADLLLPWRSVLSNVCLGGEVRHEDKRLLRKRALEHFEEFGLAGCETKYPYQLSGGMRQRAAFLRTVLCDAPIMLLDEPFGALDAITRTDMQNWLSALRHGIEKTILLVTHDIEEAIFLSDSIYLLSSQPARVIEQVNIDLPSQQRDRRWLIDQNKLKLEIYSRLNG